MPATKQAVEEFDIVGRRKSSTNGKLKTTVYGFDPDGLVTKVTDPLGHFSTRSYDADRNPVLSIDAKGNETRVEYDPVGQPRKVTRPPAVPGASETYQYSDYWPDGSLKEQQEHLHKQRSQPGTRYAYDSQGRLVSETDPGGRATGYGYDPAGNQTSKINPGGRCTAPVSGCTTMTYDAANQLRAISYSDIPADNVTIPAYPEGYDANGLRRKMIDKTGTTTWTYDLGDRLTSHKDGAGSVVTYGWDLSSRLRTIRYPGQSVPVVRDFDDAGRLWRITDWLGNPTTYTYDDNNAIETRTTPGAESVVDTFGRNDAEELTSIKIEKGPAKANLASFGYGRDLNGQVSSVTTTGSAFTAAPDDHTYGYTALNQLKDVDTGAYGYDEADNLTRTPSGGQQSYDVANQLCWTNPTASPTSTCTSNIPSTAARYGYDGRGNRTTKTPPAGQASSYGYDQANRLVTAATPGTGSNAGQYRAMPTPIRIMDTRFNGCVGTAAPCPVPDNQNRPLQVTGAANGTIPTTGVAAVVLNVTAVSPTANGYLVAYPFNPNVPNPYTSTEGVPNTSNVNYTPGQTIANQVTTKVGPTGAVGIRATQGVPGSTGLTHLIVDIVGWFTTATGQGGSFSAVTPQRIVDTRGPSGDCSSTPSGSTSAAQCTMLAANTPKTIKIAGKGGIDLAAGAAALNLTTLTQAAEGYLQLWPADTAQPGTSVMNFRANQTLSAAAVSKLSADGKVTVLASVATHLLIDTAGWYATTSDPTKTVFTPQTPARVADTRPGLATNTCPAATTNLCHTIPAGGSITIQVGGQGGVPLTGIEAVAVTITGIAATSTTGQGYLTAYQQGTTRPNTTNLTLLAAGQPVANASTVRVSQAGQITIYASAPADVIIDVAGWYHTPWATYTYNGDGLRTAKEVGGTTTNFTWNHAQGLPLLLKDGTDAYIYGPDGKPISKISSTNTVTWLHHDQLGSTRLLTDTNNNTTGTYTYDPYGNTTNHTGPATSALQYASEYTDPETGLQYLRARYYDPQTAQFLTRDPAVARTRSAYGYTGGNPLNATDPSGLFKYELNFDLGASKETPEAVFSYWMNNFDEIFPLDGTPTPDQLHEGEDLNLSAYGIPFPVRVANMGPRYMKFNTRFLHPDHKGWISFYMERTEDCHLNLRVRGYVPNVSPGGLVGKRAYRATASHLWGGLANNLNEYLDRSRLAPTS